MSLSLVSYTDKAIAVFGDISKYENALLKLGGKFNPNLNYKGEKKAGFIFPKTKSNTVASFVADPVEIPKQMESKNTTQSIQSIQNNKEHKEIENNKNNKDTIMLSREQFLNLVNTLNRLEQDVAYLKKVINDPAKSTQEVIKVPVEKITTRVTDNQCKKEEKKWADDTSDMSEDAENYSDNFDEEVELPKLLKPSKVKKPAQDEQEKKENKNKKPPSLLLQKK